MSSVDERIVQMRFDNAQFESGVRQTLSSLDKLKQGLKFNAAINGANVLQNAFNGIKLGGINRSVDQLNRKFSSLGIAGMEIVKRVTNDVLNSVTRVATAIPNQIKAGGWARALNLENAQFQLKGLGVTWDKVNNDIQYAVNGTAYGLDAAAKVAGQLAASGIQVSDSALTATKSVDDFSASCMGMKSAELKSTNQLDEMSTALRSISGVAAMSNSSFEEIGQIYTRVAGQGRVMADDLNSIASRGLNAAATLGKYLGKTETEVRDMVSKGQIDFKTFSDAMYDAYADQAVKANDTFQGALSNTKSALSRIGADVADDLLPALTKILNSCRKLFNQVHKWIQPILDSTGKLVTQIGDTLSPIIDGITSKIQKITGIAGGPIEQIAGVIDKITSKVKGVGNDILSYFGLDPETAKKAEEVVKSVDTTVTESAEHITEMAKRVIRGDFGNEPVRSKNLEAIGESFEVIQNKVNELLGCSKRYEVQENKEASAVKKTAEATEEATQKVEGLSKARDELGTKGHMLNGFLNIAKTLKFSIETIADAVKSTTSKLASDFKSLDKLSFAKGFDEFTGKLINSRKNMETFKTVVNDIVSGIGNLLEALGKVAAAFGKAFIETLSEIKGKDPTKASGAFKKLSENLNLSKEGVEGLKDVFKALLSPLKVIVPLSQTLGRVILEVAAAFAKLNGKILEFIGKSKILDSIGKIFSNIGKAIKTVFEGIKNSSGFQKFIDSIERFASVVGTKLGDAFTKLAEWTEKVSGMKLDSGAFDGIINGFSAFFDGLSKVFDTFSDLIEGKKSIKDVLSELGESIKEGFEKLWSDIKEGVSNIDFSNVNPQKIFASLKTAITNAFANFSFKDSFKGIGSKISKDAAAALKESGGLSELDNGLDFGSGDNVSQAIAKNVKLPKIDLPSFSDIINGIGKAFDKIKDWLAPKIKAAGAAIKDAFKNFDFGKFINNIWKVFTKIEFGKIIKGISDFFSGIGDITKNAGKVVKSVSTLISSIAGIPKQISGLIEDFRKSLKAGVKADVFKSFAIGVLAIAGALMMISMIKVEKLGPSVLALGVIMAGLVAVVKYVNDMDIDTKKMSSFGKYAILMGVALLAISRAIKRIAGFDAKSLAGAVVSLSAVIAVMTACLRKMGDSKINFGTAVGYAIAMSAVVSAVSRGLARLAKYDWKSLIAPAAAMSAVIFAVTKAISQLSKDGPSFGQSVGYAILLGVIVTSVSNALGNLAQYSWQSLTAAAIALSGTIAAVIASTNLLNDNGGTFGQSVGYAILLGVLVGSVSSALDNLAQYSWESLTAAAIALSGTIAAVMASTNLLNNNGGSFGQSVGYAILLGVIVSTVSGALENLAQYSWQSLTAAAIALSGTIAAIVLSTNLLNDNGGTFGQSVGYAILLGVIVTTVSGALSTLSQYSWESLTAAAIALSGTIIAVMAAVNLLSGGTNIASAAASALSIGMVLGTVATIFGILLNVIPDPNSVLPVAEGLSLALGAIVASLEVIAHFGGGAGLITAGAELSAAIGVAASIITGFIAAFGGLNMLTGGGLKTAIDQGGEILQAVGEAVGKLVSGFGVGATSGLPEIGSNLEAFGNSFANFANSAKQISGAESGIREMISTITLLTGESFLDSIAKFFGGGIENELNSVADAMASFCEKLSGVDVTNVTKLTDFASAVKTIGTVNTDGLQSVVDAVSGIKEPIQDISGLGGQLTTAANNLTTFAQSISNINVADTTKLDQLADSISRFSTDAVSKFSSSLSNANVSGAVNGFVGKIKSSLTSGLNSAASITLTAGKNIGSKFATGLGTTEATARNKAAAIGRAVVAMLNSMVGRVGPIGTRFGQRFAAALQGSAGIARSAGLAVGQNASIGLSNASSYAYSSGLHFSQNFANGINAGAAAAISAAQSIASRVKNILGHTTPKEGPMKHDDVWGEHMAENFANGIAKATDKVRKSAYTMSNAVWNEVRKANEKGGKSIDDFAKSLSTSAYKYLDKAIKTRELTQQEVVLYWNDLLDITKKSASAMLEENSDINEAIYKSAEQLVSDHKDKVDEYITNEADLWNKVVSLTAEGTNAREEALSKFNDALVSDADNAVTKYEKSVKKYYINTATFYKNAIDKAKEYGATQKTVTKLNEKYMSEIESNAEQDLSRIQTYYDMSSAQQALYWKGVLGELERGTDAYSKAEDKFLSARNDAWNSYTSSVKSTVSKLGSDLSLGSEFQLNDTKFDILSNTKNEENALKSYSDLTTAIYDRGILSADNFRTLMNEFGVKDLKYIQQIQGLSDENLKALNDSLNNMSKMENLLSEHVNKDLKPDFLYTDKDIEDITGSTINVMKTISDIAGDPKWIDSVSKSLIGVGNAASENIAENVATIAALSISKVGSSDVFKKSVFSSVNNAAGTFHVALKDLNAQKTLADWVQKTTETAADDSEEYIVNDYTTLGNNLIDGLIKGIAERSPDLVNAVSQSVKAAIEGGRVAADAHSPARKTIKLGGDIGNGLVIGLKKWLSSAGSMGKNLGNSALSGMNYMLSALASDINDNMDMQPVIRPVIDMSDVMSSANAINSMLSSEQAMNIAAGYDTIAASRQNGSSGSVTNDNSVGSININIYPTENQNANDISDTVIKKLNNEIIRKRKVYA